MQPRCNVMTLVDDLHLKSGIVYLILIGELKVPFYSSVFGVGPVALRSWDANVWEYEDLGRRTSRGAGGMIVCVAWRGEDHSSMCHA